MVDCVVSLVLLKLNLSTCVRKTQQQLHTREMLTLLLIKWRFFAFLRRRLFSTACMIFRQICFLHMKGFIDYFGNNRYNASGMQYVYYMAYR